MARRTASFAAILTACDEPNPLLTARSSRPWKAISRRDAARQVLDRSAFLNSLIDERSFPWTKIFMDLEQTLPPGVRVVSIAPRLDNGRAEVTLQIGAQSDESKIEFLKAIEKSKQFTGMVVKDEQHREQAGEDKIILDLSVWYSTI